MIRNYLKIALNIIFANKLFSLINIFGLALGIACSVLISLFVLDELSYDSYHLDAERIYRISRDFYASERSEEMLLAANAPQVAVLLTQDFPEIEHAVRLYGGRVLLRQDNIAYYEDDIQFVDANFFELFDFEWLGGDQDTALIEPFTMVLTESLAQKYFGAEDPIGQTLTVENAAPVRVTGVIKDLPLNTHFQVDAFGSFSSLVPFLGEAALNDWGSNNFHTYIKLYEGADIKLLETQFSSFLNRHFDENASIYNGMSAMPLKDIHLKSVRQFELSEPGSMTNIYIFTAVAFCILIIACFNFMNLSTARSTMRAKEVGVRKSIGAQRYQLVRQFMVESLLMAFISMIIALVLIELCLPMFSEFVGKELNLNILNNPRLLIGLISLVMFIGLFAGSYPAFYLSSFKPAQVLKTNAGTGVKDVFLRNCLVILQFSVSIVLVVATMVVFLQMKYARELELGFSKDQIVVLSGSATEGLGSQWGTLKQELLKHSEISNVTASNVLPLEENGNAFGVWAEGDPDGRKISFMMVDIDFFTTYEIALVAGRGFSEDFPNDQVVMPDESNSQTTGNYVLNASAAKLYGWSPEDAVGKTFSVYVNQGFASGLVIGVVEDSYFESVHMGLKPLVFVVPPEGLWNNFPTLNDAAVKITGQNLIATLAYIDKVWSTHLPELPVARHFLNEDFNAMYLKDEKQGVMFSYFSILAISIACLGLFGLASFNTQRRIKEIGVRKVMGGSAWSIVLLLTNDFSKLVLISNLLAWPVAYFAMESWLEGFAYRIDLRPLIFIASGLIALCIAWVTVGGTAAKAANAKPVLALRYE